MKVMIVGGGGRENALIWQLKHSPEITSFIAVPGNGGISDMAECIDIPLINIDQIRDLAVERQVDLTIIGPEVPLNAGIVDLFQSSGLKVFGPNKLAARLEGSKDFSKKLMLKYGIPTANANSYQNFDEAILALQDTSYPIVIKADGLAQGKGVIICHTHDEAKAAISECMVESKFGDAGATVLLEEYLSGREVSLLLITDGTNVVALPPAMDYKRAKDRDEGLNTGGMGCVCPTPYLTSSDLEVIQEKITNPTLNALRSEGINFAGVLYIGLILTDDGPKVLEYNTRFGDPETQVIMPLIKGSILPVILAAAEGDLSGVSLDISHEKCVSVTLCSDGYPESYPTGEKIHGLDMANLIPGVEIFHAGTKFDGTHYLTSGGRVLNISAVGDTFEIARDRAYEAVKIISYHSKYYRSDIALNIQ